jgi:hypothetical protein
MSIEERTELQQEIVRALIESKAVNFEAAGEMLAKYGERAALEGSGLVFGIHRPVHLDWCIPVDFQQRFRGADLQQD